MQIVTTICRSPAVSKQEVYGYKLQKNKKIFNRDKSEYTISFTHIL